MVNFFFAVIIFGHLAVFTGLTKTGEVAQSQESSDLGWSEYGFIDIHAHIGSFRGFDLKTETLLSNLRRFDICLALISRCICSEKNTAKVTLNSPPFVPTNLVNIIMHQNIEFSQYLGY